MASCRFLYITFLALATATTGATSGLLILGELALGDAHATLVISITILVTRAFILMVLL